MKIKDVPIMCAALLIATCSAMAQAPVIVKTIPINPVAAGKNSYIQFELDNPQAAPINGLNFIDTMPAGMVVADPGLFSNNCSGVIAPIGSGTIQLTNGNLAARGC